MSKILTVLTLTAALAIVACRSDEEPAGREAAADTPASAGVAGPGPVDTAAIREIVTRMRESWVRSAEANDPAGIAALYAEDAVMVGAGGQRLEGREAIEGGLTGALADLSNMHVTSIVTEMGPELVSDMGSFTQVFRGEAGEQTVHGFYLVVARHRPDGGWQIVQHLGGPFESARGAAAEAERADTAGTDPAEPGSG